MRLVRAGTEEEACSVFSGGTGAARGRVMRANGHQMVTRLSASSQSSSDSVTSNA